LSTPLYDPERYLVAVHYVAKMHHGQLYPGTELPYLLHLHLVTQEVVAALSVEAVEDPELAVLCALLHDSVEDTPATLQHIGDLFGVAVMNGVSALTKDSSLPKPARMGDSLARIRREPREVWMVKLADRITNLQSPPAHWRHAKCERYGHQAQTICDELGDASPWLKARITAKIGAYPALYKNRLDSPAGPEEPHANPF
jgi:(p)ppGpp synthase/HD superfamily hydrolase